MNTMGPISHKFHVVLSKSKASARSSPRHLVDLGRKVVAELNTKPDPKGDKKLTFNTRCQRVVFAIKKRSRTPGVKSSFNTKNSRPKNIDPKS